jgi:hypothetical protein
MGSISHFDLQKIQHRYGCQHFVETGTGTGEGLAYATTANFTNVLSIEIVAELAAKAQQRFAHDRRVQIMHGTTAALLPQVLSDVPPKEPILFWLDAHFPGADFGLAKYNAEQKTDLRLPLEEELRIIRRLRPDGLDTIIIDDLRIYIDGPFEKGNTPEYAQTLPAEARHVDFVAELFSSSHRCTSLYDDEGYLVLVPRTSWLGATGLTKRSLKDRIPSPVRTFVKKLLRA